MADENQVYMGLSLFCSSLFSRYKDLKDEMEPEIIKRIPQLQELKADANKRTLLLKHFVSQCCLGEQTGRKQNTFFFRDANSTFSLYIARVRKPGNIRKHAMSVFLQCFQMFSRLRPHAIYVEDTKSASRKQKLFLKLTKKNFSSWTQSCFCYIVSSFALVLRGFVTYIKMQIH